MKKLKRNNLGTTWARQRKNESARLCSPIVATGVRDAEMVGFISSRLTGGEQAG
jgi:hypothetical protein